MMNPHPLNSRDRMHVREIIQEELRARGADLFGSDEQTTAMFDRHLDALVDIERRTKSDRIEPYLAQLLDEVCGACPKQDRSGFCPLRYEGTCVIFAHAQPILRCIALALEQIRDPEYLVNHPLGAGNRLEEHPPVQPR